MEERVDIEGELKAGDGIKVSDDTKYEYGADLATDGAPVIDPGTGKAVSIRLFEFKMNPQLVESSLPLDKQEIFNAHAKQISTIMWADGLAPLDTVAPRVIIDMKRERYLIFVPCEARIGTTFAELPKNLSQELSKKKN